MVELEHPLESIAAVMAFSTLDMKRKSQAAWEGDRVWNSIAVSPDRPPIDWLSDPRLAWVWGVVHGWGPEDEDWHRAANVIGWDDSTLDRLRRLHRKYRNLRASQIVRSYMKMIGIAEETARDLGDLP